MKYLLLLSTYNNEKNFIDKYTELQSHDLDVDILVIDRGSTDRTKHFLRNNDVQRLEMSVHASYYDAISLGLAYAREHKYDGVVEFDINGRFSIKEIPYLIATYENTKTDFVLGSRYLDKSLKIKKRNRIIRFASRITTGQKITDPTTRLRLFGKKSINFFGNLKNLRRPEPDRVIQLIKVGYTFKEVQIEMAKKFKKQNPHKTWRAISETTTWIFSILLSNPFRKEGK